MPKWFYRVLVVVFLILTPCKMLAAFASSWGELEVHPVVAAITISLLLQLISAIGLWCERRWGFRVLLAAWALGLFVSPVAFSPLVMLVITFIRFSEAKMERGRLSKRSDLPLDQFH